MRDLLGKARARGASDLHLTLGNPPFVRIDGELVLMEEPPLGADDIRRLVEAAMTEEHIRRYETDWATCFTVNLDELGFFRVTVYRHQGAMEAAIRVGIPEVPSREMLGLPNVLFELTRKRHGLILITGPTGAGKTTTLNALIDHINRERRSKIILVEDPIEYQHRNVRSIVIQQEIRTDVKSFGQAVVNMLRQDPDVIGVGEMRDAEAIAAVLTAAETGHLVLATLHSNDAPQTINRIVDVFPERQHRQIRSQLALSLRAIINQRLVSRADGRGRALAYGMLVGNPALKNLITENKLNQIPNLMTSGKREGMVLMDDVLRELYQRAEISYDDAASLMEDATKLHKKGDSSVRRGDTPLGLSLSSLSQVLGSAERPGRSVTTPRPLADGRRQGTVPEPEE